jgi:cholesterol transport system auxiliary component
MRSRLNTTHFIPALVALALLAGCTVVQPVRTPDATYDFGPPAAAATAKFDKSVMLAEAAAPVWMDVPHMTYRMAQSAPAQPRSYANSRWVMSPAALFTQRLKGRLADASKGAYSPNDGVRTDLTLRVELEEFAQVFDSATASRGVVRVRASLSGGKEAPVQKAFMVDRPAATADADGGAKALIAASDEAIKQIVEWTAASGKGR